MHIKKLEICGFKSFVDRTVIHFDHDVIGIVGPNGCGKSNIVDAIRWCMGEQSAKHLRGRSMEDVIFNGSESRPQHGLAEVTLTFDNSDETYALGLPEAYRAYPEIAVTRRLFRDGTSEYLLNKTAVRLRDVTDLFLGTGVGTKAYSIIEQGRVGQIVTSRPQDRRTYIEEAAGVTKYRLRRKQAERKLDLTRQNLLRITDIVSEIDRNRGSLKRQAAKAERYVGYRNELEDLFLHDASHRLLEIIVVERLRASGRADVAEHVATVRTRLAEGDQSLLAAREEAAQIEQRFDVLSRERAAADQRVTQQQSEAARLVDRLGHLEERSQAFRAEEAALSEKRTGLQNERAALLERIDLLSRDENARNEETLLESTALAELEARERALVLELDSLRNKLSSARSEKAALSSRLDALTLRRHDAESNLTRIENDQQQLADEYAQLLSQQQSAANALTSATEKSAAAAAAIAELETQLGEFLPQLTSEQQHIDRLNADLNLKRSRLKVLEDLHARLEGVGAGTKALLTSSDPTIVGLLADRLEVEDDYAQALAGVLGERLHTVIVEDPERGLSLLSELRENKRGRATIALQRPTPVSEAASPAADDSVVLGRLLDQLVYAPEDEALIRALVGETLVVRTPTEALALNQRFPGTRIATLDGTVVRGNGLVSGGSGDNVAAALIEQKREIRELTRVLAELLGTHTEADSNIKALQARIAALREQLDARKQAAYQAEAEHKSAQKDQARSAQDLSRLELRRSRLASDAEGYKQQFTALGSEQEQAVQAEAILNEGEAALLASLAEVEERTQTAKREAAAQAARATERRIWLAQVREQLEGHRATLQRLELETAEANTRLTRLEVDLSETAEAQAAASAQLVTTREVLAVAEVDAEALEKRTEDTRALLEQVRDSLSQREGELRELRASATELDEQLRDHEMELQKLALGREHLLQSVGERFRGLDLNRVVGDYHRRPPPDLEHRRRIDELSKLIERMGPVNLDARDEYNDAERRFVELNGQREDIEKAVSELERAIRHMDRESRRRFKETFDAVNELFKRGFAKLFKGGRAELKLTDPENLLETGVDIIAQPPGKKLGNIELMSGGEKALTAAALIFAIFQHRPSPFCVLDEVDAPLDDANVGRYNEAIRTMTSGSQFIVITHIKQTMQAVDVLYGVTMGEPGVSRVVSVKVNEAAQARSARNDDAMQGAAAPAQVVA